MNATLANSFLCSSAARLLNCMALSLALMVLTCAVIGGAVKANPEPLADQALRPSEEVSAPMVPTEAILPAMEAKPVAAESAQPAEATHPVSEPVDESKAALAMPAVATPAARSSVSTVSKAVQRLSCNRCTQTPDFEISILSVRPVTPPAHNVFHVKPGHRYLLTEVSIKNLKKAPLRLAIPMMSTYLVDFKAGKQYGFTPDVLVAYQTNGGPGFNPKDHEKLFGGQIEPGATVRGFLGFEVPLSAQGLTLRFFYPKPGQYHTVKL
jgi:hypothetical protein